MIDPNVPLCLFYAAHLHLQCLWGEAWETDFCVRNQELCVKCPVVTFVHNDDKQSGSSGKWSTLSEG